MSLYLYLNEYWHVDTWVSGGVIPINPASTYRSMEREGIYTPDENIIHKSNVDLLSLSPFIGFGPNGGVKNLNIINCRMGGKLIPDIVGADYYSEDGLILSFSHRLTKIVAKKMRKKACVKILDIFSLKESLDAQLGVISEARDCEYTLGHERNHFLKSELDSWQEEFRLFWPLTAKVEVTVPKGTAELICTW